MIGGVPPDWPLDENRMLRAISWGQEILPELRERYSGKLVFKVCFEYLDIANFSGYDYASFSLGPVGYHWGPEVCRENIHKIIDLGLSLAARDNCEGVIIGELWAFLELVGDEQAQAKVIQIAFEESWEKVKGIFVQGWEHPGSTIKNKPMEQVVKEWYTKP